jgi:hypothetical protein
MLAIEKPFPVVQAGLGGFGALAAGFIGSVALLSILVPTTKTPSSQPASSPVAVTEESPTTKVASADPHQFISTYTTSAYTWRTATPVRSSSVASQANTATNSTTASATSAASTPTQTVADNSSGTGTTTNPTPGMGSTGTQPSDPTTTITTPVVTIPIAPLPDPIIVDPSLIPTI